MNEKIIFESNLIGPKGDNGITPTIGDNGNWYLGDADTGKSSRGLQGQKGEKGEQGDIGPQGIQGLQGEPGKTTNLSIGKVTNGKTASATITGESPNYTLDLVLPEGEKGETGPQGPKGEKGVQGEQGIQGPKGEQGHTPAVGVDYFTEEDKKEINATNKEYIDSLFGNVNEILSTLTEVAK